MKKDFKDRLGSCVKDLTGAEIKGITIDEEGGQVAVVLVPGRGHGRVSLSQLPDVLKVADVDIVGGDITLLGAYAGVRDFVESWNLEADDPRIGRFIEILRRETRGEVTNVEFRSGELLYELTVRTLDFTAPEYVYIEGVDFRSRVRRRGLPEPGPLLLHLRGRHERHPGDRLVLHPGVPVHRVHQELDPSTSLRMTKKLRPCGRSFLCVDKPVNCRPVPGSGPAPGAPGRAARGCGHP